MIGASASESIFPPIDDSTESMENLNIFTNSSDSQPQRRPSLPVIIKETIEPQALFTSEIERKSSLTNLTNNQNRNSNATSNSKNDSNHQNKLEEIENLQSEIVKLQYYLDIERGRNRPQKTVSGAQFRLPMKDYFKCQSCHSLDQVNKRAKETIRSLKLQITRFEDTIRELRKTKLDGGNLGDISAILESNTRLKLQCETLENEVKNLSKKQIDQTQILEMTQNKLTIVSEELKNNQHENVKLTTACEELQQQNHILEKEMKVIKGHYDHVKEENKRLIHLLGSHEGSYQTQSNEINALQKEIKFRDEKLRVSESNLEKLNLSLNERNDKLAKLEIEYERLKNEKASQDELLVKMKDDSQKHSKDLSAKAMALADAERRLQDLQMDNERLLAQIDLKNRELTSHAENYRSLHREGSQKLLEKERREADLIEKMTADSVTTKLALEKAISSSVRLCVVAPAVSVHIGEETLELKSGVSTEKLKDFLNVEVLNNYSFLFKQRSENASPDEKLSIQEWVQQMLSRMQAAIEQHVRVAVNGS